MLQPVGKPASVTFLALSLCLEPAVTRGGTQGKSLVFQLLADGVQELLVVASWPQ